MAKTLSKIKPHAFSLLELLLVMSLLAILSLVSLTTWHKLNNRWRQWTLVNQVRQGLAFARLQAILHKKSTIFCGSADGLHCDGQWQLGQLIKFANGQILQKYPPMPTGFTLAYFGNLNHNIGITFTAQGFTAGQQGHFRLCFKQCHRLIVHFSGQVV